MLPDDSIFVVTFTLTDFGSLLKYSIPQRTMQFDKRSTVFLWDIKTAGLMSAPAMHILFTLRW